LRTFSTTNTFKICSLRLNYSAQPRDERRAGENIDINARGIRVLGHWRAAGFIGSHLTDKLLSFGCEVLGFDNLSSGSKTNLKDAMRNPKFHLIEGDLLNPNEVEGALDTCDIVFHLAADPEVRTGESNPKAYFRQNLEATLDLLEVIRKPGRRVKMVFASTLTIYGQASVIPTPEYYGPLLPISIYGATKLGCEALVASYTELLPFSAIVFRFANVVGLRARHGVIYDFIKKLQKNPHELEILGDGTQSKSYMHIDDCIDAFLLTLNGTFWSKPIEVYNIGTQDQTDVMTIAKIVTDKMGLGDVIFKTKPNAGGRAWPGDVRVMQLDISKIKRQGWKPFNSQPSNWSANS
jgi:UDP-glucose 4-epimerase